METTEWDEVDWSKNSLLTWIICYLDALTINDATRVYNESME